MQWKPDSPQIPIKETSDDHLDWLLWPIGIVFEFDIKKDKNPVKMRNTISSLSKEERNRKLAIINENLNETVNPSMHKQLMDMAFELKTIKDEMQKPKIVIHNHDGIVQTISENSISQGSSFNAPIIKEENVKLTSVLIPMFVIVLAYLFLEKPLRG